MKLTRTGKSQGHQFRSCKESKIQLELKGQLTKKNKHSDQNQGCLTSWSITMWFFCFLCIKIIFIVILRKKWKHQQELVYVGTLSVNSNDNIHNTRHYKPASIILSTFASLIPLICKRFFLGEYATASTVHRPASFSFFTSTAAIPDALTIW